MAYTDIDDPSAYFQTTLYTGNGQAGHAITNSGNSDLAPNWVWIKSRDDTSQHRIYDTVRGIKKPLKSDLNNAEGTDNNGVTAFGSDGFTLGNEAQSNGNNLKFASWNWKAGTAVSGNTTGSGTAKAYTGSVNTDAGFSIIRYLGNAAAGHTVPHHLGVAPKAMIVKSLAASQSWFINFPFGTGAGYIMLDRTNAGDGSNDSVWSSTAPSSSVVTLGETGGVNENNDAYIMYAFAEKQGYSKFGSYKGNGNANGTFVYTGFKPAFVIVKRTDATNYWFMFDDKRSTSGSNPTDKELYPNGNEVEDTSARFDFLSNGFKNRLNSAGSNTSGGSYIYIAFSENPFVTSTGVPATAK